MKALKGILIALVVTLMLILGVGGALIGFNHNGNETDHQTASGNVDNKETQQNNNQDNNSKNNSQQNEGKEPDPKQVIVASEQIAPEEYLKRIKEAQEMINEATNLITNEAYQDTENPNATKEQNSDVQGMDKIHQGIYKLAQGNTLMTQALQGMEQEIKKTREANGSFYQIPPSTSANYYYIPNGGWPFPYQNQMIQPNQSDPQSQNGSNIHNSGTNTGGSSHATTGISSLSFFNSENIVFAIYGFLIVSLIGIFVAIVGFLNSILKPSKVQQ